MNTCLSSITTHQMTPGDFGIFYRMLRFLWVAKQFFFAPTKQRK